ncbi:zinc ribbon domain-containing protein [Neobacillus sp. D3-1R]|uniref:zinc ribbon domain-containing protein n=1 Tax=Neobacillus sp. D3-1R TaxID=3445778 RepID=UPI003FA0802E
MNFCTNCGTESIEKANFCYQCGIQFMKIRKISKNHEEINKSLEVEKQVEVKFSDFAKTKDIPWSVLCFEYKRLLSRDRKGYKNVPNALYPYITNVIIEKEYIQELIDFCDNPFLICNFVKIHNLYEPDVRTILRKNGYELNVRIDDDGLHKPDYRTIFRKKGVYKSSEIIDELLIEEILLMSRSLEEGERHKEEEKQEREKEREKERERLLQEKEIKEKKQLEERLEKERLEREERKKQEEERKELFKKKNEHIFALKKILKNDKPYFVIPKEKEEYVHIYDRLLKPVFKYKTPSVEAVVKLQSTKLFFLLKERGLFIYTPVANWIIIAVNPIDKISTMDLVYIFHAHAYNKGWHFDRDSKVKDEYDLKMLIRHIIMHDWDSSIANKREKRNYSENKIYIEGLRDLSLI